jgi:hypothetical protein
MYWQARVDLEGGTRRPAARPRAGDGPHHADVDDEEREHRRRVEGDLKKRLPGGRSPNKGDAFVYWNWVRDRSELVSELRKRHPTRLDQLKAEIDKLDRQDEDFDERRRGGDRPYGGVLRQ